MTRNNRHHHGLYQGIFSLLIYFIATTAPAHDVVNLNKTSIDRTNDLVVNNIELVQQLLSNIFMRKETSTSWPDQQIIRMKNDLLHLQEETVSGLDYLTNNGINIQDPEVLRADPYAGRTVAAGQAVDVAMNLLKHAESLESQGAFIAEIYNGGLSAYMYNLLGAHKDRMVLYKELMNSTN